VSQSASTDDGTGGGDGELDDDMIEWMRGYDRLKGNGGDVHRDVGRRMSCMVKGHKGWRSTN
jgi:hypothetical protein